MLCEEMAEQVEDLIQDCTAASDVPVPGLYGTHDILYS